MYGLMNDNLLCAEKIGCRKRTRMMDLKRDAALIPPQVVIIVYELR